jgi:hypothetical protein
VPSAPINDEAKKRNGSLPGQGGVFNYVNLHVYHYAGNNPVKYVDPDGKELSYDAENKTINCDLTQVDLDTAFYALSITSNLNPLTGKTFYDKVVATDGDGNQIAFNSKESLHEYLSLTSNGGVIFMLGAGFNVGTITSTNANAGIMIGFSNEGIKIHSYGDVGVATLIVDASVSVRFGLIEGTGDPSKLNGYSPTTGASAGNGLFLGMDVLIDNGSGITGTSFSLGVTGRGMPVDIHAGVNWTQTRKIWESGK